MDAKENFIFRRQDAWQNSLKRKKICWDSFRTGKLQSLLHKSKIILPLKTNKYQNKNLHKAQLIST